MLDERISTMIQALPVLENSGCDSVADFPPRRDEIERKRREYRDRCEEMAQLFRDRFGIDPAPSGGTDSMAWGVVGFDDGRKGRPGVNFPVFGIVFRVEGKVFSGRWKSYRPLLSANSKLRKLPGRAGRYRAIGLAMAPANYSGGELCPWRTDGCTTACNGFWSGMNVTVSTRLALIGRALLFHHFRGLFLRKLRTELENFGKLCKRTGVIPAVRLNVSTDIVYERLFAWVFDDFPGIRFLDYTKALPRHRSKLPANYSLCHSFNEKTTVADVEAIVKAGRNVVIAFDSAYAPSRGLWGALPKSVRFRDSAGRDFILPVVNGDRHDLRLPEMDGRGVVVGLHGKSGRKRVDSSVESGFMIHHSDGAKLRKVSRFDGMVVVDR
jgi:hypothetical protein